MLFPFLEHQVIVIISIENSYFFSSLTSSKSTSEISSFLFLPFDLFPAGVF
jgi:nitrate reductase NapE component